MNYGSPTTTILSDMAPSVCGFELVQTVARRWMTSSVGVTWVLKCQQPPFLGDREVEGVVP